MRKSIALGTFAALAAGSAGAGALDAVPAMKGSDTLKNITVSILGQCADLASYPTNPPIVYDGTGSGNGENIIRNNPSAQWIAPMSRPLGGAGGASPSGICAGSADRSTAEGLVFALDALSIVSDGGRPGPANGIETAPPTGGDWKAVLRTIYTGMPATGNNTFARDCNSQTRKDLVNNWDAIFGGASVAGTCTDSNPDNGVTEPGLRHAFRRDEESGTTDVFLAQLSLPSLNLQQTGANTAVTPAGSSPEQTAVYRALAHSPFCNVYRPDDKYQPVKKGTSIIPAMNNIGTPPGVTGTGYAPFDPALGPSPAFIQPFFPETMDQDPIRRTCIGPTVTIADAPNAPREEVCSADGKLGVVLPITVPPGTLTPAQRYPSIPCESDTRDFELGPAPLRPTGDPVRCPNGDIALNSKCFLPVRTDASRPQGYSFDCLNNGLGTPAATFDSDGNGSIFSDAPETDGRSDADGRAYNLILRQADGTIRTMPRPNPVAINTVPTPIIGAYYRIHSSRSGIAGSATSKTCATNDDATDQIGCLTLANPCSIGYAGGGTITTNPGTVAAPVNNIAPTAANVQALVVGGTIYPLARKLYVNTVRGFENLLNSSATVAGKDAELDLAQCFAQGPFSTFASVGFASKLNVASPAFGFVPLPPPVGGGEPFSICEDVSDTLCGGSTNADACSPVGAVSNPTQIPSSSCNNGYKDGAETGVDTLAGFTCNTTTHAWQ